ncbi:MAG: FHA domain-containing protein [Nocardioides sp.]
MTDATAARSYRPGQWFGIFGERAVVLLPPSQKARVGTLWALVDDGAGFDVVLDALISEGLRDLPGFVLVAAVDGETKVVIRGEAKAWFTTGDGNVEVAGTDVTTWAERSFVGVTATRLVVGPEGEEVADGGPLPIDNGLVRVSEVLSPPASPDVEVRGAPATSHETPEPEPEPDPTPEPEPDPTPDTGLPQLETEAFPPPPPLAGTPSGPPPPIEHDGDTQTGLIAEPDPAEADAEANPGVSRPVARLVFSSGEDLEVDRAVLVGRAPEARRFTSGDQPRLVTVPSPAQEISSTHLEIRPGSGADHGSAVVTDLGSTNGTVLVQPGLPPEELQAGIAVQLVPGAIIDLGDGVTIQVINP